MCAKLRINMSKKDFFFQKCDNKISAVQFLFRPRRSRKKLQVIRKIDKFFKTGKRCSKLKLAFNQRDDNLMRQSNVLLKTQFKHQFKKRLFSKYPPKSCRIWTTFKNSQIWRQKQPNLVKWTPKSFVIFVWQVALTLESNSHPKLLVSNISTW